MAQKTLQEIIVEKKLTSTQALSKYLKGKTVMIIAPRAGFSPSGHNQGPTGTKIKVNTVTNFYYNTVNTTLNVRGGGNVFYAHELVLAGGTAEDLRAERAELVKSIEDTEKEIKDVEGKLAYLKDNNLDEYDEELFRVLDVLTVIDDKKLDKVQRAKAVMQLMAG